MKLLLHQVQAGKFESNLKNSCCPVASDLARGENGCCLSFCWSILYFHEHVARCESKQISILSTKCFGRDKHFSRGILRSFQTLLPRTKNVVHLERDNDIFMSGSKCSEIMTIGKYLVLLHIYSITVLVMMHLLNLTNFLTNIMTTELQNWKLKHETSYDKWILLQILPFGSYVSFFLIFINLTNRWSTYRFWR